MNDWVYETAPDLSLSYLERLRGFPREPDMFTYAARCIVALTVRGWLRTYHRLAIEGAAHLPLDRSFILIANHTSHLDALALLAALPLTRLHRAFPAAACDYFFSRPPRVALAAIVANALPFDRRTHIRHSLHLCRALLENPGNILVVFPEGTRSADGETAVFRPGVGALVAGAETLVAPCYIAGAFRALPKGAWFPRPVSLRVRIGPPLSFADRPRNRESVARICQELRAAVMALRDPDPPGRA